MSVGEVLALLEKRSKEHRERCDSRAQSRTPEGRIAVQIHASVAEELDSLIAEIREKMAGAKSLCMTRP